MKIYLASSWKNPRHNEVLKALRDKGHEVYDYRTDGNFHWSEIDPDYMQWNISDFRKGLQHPIAKAAFQKDFFAMNWADICVLILPSGRSSHIEAGWFVGKGKRLYILSTLKGQPAELTYTLATVVTMSIPKLLAEIDYDNPYNAIHRKWEELVDAGRVLCVWCSQPLTLNNVCSERTAHESCCREHKMDIMDGYHQYIYR